MGILSDILTFLGVLALIIGLGVACVVVGTAFLDNFITPMMNNIRSKKPIVPDIYNPNNSTVKQAYNQCIRTLEQSGYRLIEGEFEKQLWISASNFSDFLDFTTDHNVSTVFVDAPALRGMWLWTYPIIPEMAFIYYHIELNGDTVTVYYALKY